ncbi:hypothetical protein MPTK2_8g03170 [Marchantia polymorpha subsp. ruderalis]
MAASLCHCLVEIGGKSVAPSSRISSSGVESAPLSVAFGKESSAVTLGTHSNGKSMDDVVDRSVRWRTNATAAAATFTLFSAAPGVLAAEVDFADSTTSHSVPGDSSLSIAIPIPDQGTWIFAQNGFLAPPPRGSVTGVASMRSQGGCPSWHPIQFEMVVPDGVHPKSFPRQGPQWPAMYIMEDESEVLLSEVVETSDPSIRYASILDALLRMADSSLTCFRL